MKSERISPFWVNGYQPFSATTGGRPGRRALTPAHRTYKPTQPYNHGKNQETRAGLLPPGHRLHASTCRAPPDETAWRPRLHRAAQRPVRHLRRRGLLRLLQRRLLRGPLHRAVRHRRPAGGGRPADGRQMRPFRRAPLPRTRHPDLGPHPGAIPLQQQTPPQAQPGRTLPLGGNRPRPRRRENGNGSATPRNCNANTRKCNANDRNCDANATKQSTAKQSTAKQKETPPPGFPRQRGHRGGRRPDAAAGGGTGDSRRRLLAATRRRAESARRRPATQLRQPPDGDATVAGPAPGTVCHHPEKRLRPHRPPRVAGHQRDCEETQGHPPAGTVPAEQVQVGGRAEILTARRQDGWARIIVR